MNLRILKKLSKRAAPLLAVLGDHRRQYICDDPRDPPAIETWSRMDRKHWDRTRAVWEWGSERPWAGSIHRRPRRGKGTLVLRPPFAGWPGTVMVGSTVGYEEPEWEEESAWEALRENLWARAAVAVSGDPENEYPDHYEVQFRLTPRNVFRWLRENAEAQQ